MKRIDWPFTVVWALAVLFWIVAILCLGSCGSRDGGSCGQSPHTAGSDLIALGHACSWIGGLGLVAGAVIAFVIGLRPVGAVIAEAAGVTLACGLAFTWLGDHIGWIIAACVAAGLAWAYHRRVFLLGWIRRRLADRAPSQPHP